MAIETEMTRMDAQGPTKGLSPRQLMTLAGMAGHVREMGQLGTDVRRLQRQRRELGLQVGQRYVRGGEVLKEILVALEFRPGMRGLTQLYGKIGISRAFGWRCLRTTDWYGPPRLAQTTTSPAYEDETAQTVDGWLDHMGRRLRRYVFPAVHSPQLKHLIKSVMLEVLSEAERWIAEATEFDLVKQRAGVYCELCGRFLAAEKADSGNGFAEFVRRLMAEASDEVGSDVGSPTDVVPETIQPLDSEVGE